MNQTIIYNFIMTNYYSRNSVYVYVCVSDSTVVQRDLLAVVMDVAIELRISSRI